mgnify:CR=1 FL=1
MQSIVEIGTSDKIKYLIFGEERGAEGTPHLQGYVTWVHARTFACTKSLLGTRVHLEVAKGNAQANKVYCEKEGKFKEFGSLPQQGKRSDLDDVKDMIEQGSTELEIAQTHFGDWTRYRVGFREYRALLNRPVSSQNYPMDSFPMEWQNIIWDWSRTQILWGESGIGKTEFATALLPGALMVSHMDDLKHFDPDLHSGIIFDDVDVKHFPRNAQIHLMDQTKDRSIHIRYGCGFIPKGTKKIFTTNELNGSCCLIEDSAIRRRIKVNKLSKIY